ncbi:CDA_G0000940.mRNA.1.CDS.1 [Saccharomyces cerevisiae]|nr:CDA_G0000940.mRNA.1.CDS.1 [Saccharomyces cerevisiae]CAI7130229.1 CDA_G0000940.mRNA.1.CDS.1 [Saccharomyces cerevisiae]
MNTKSLDFYEPLEIDGQKYIKMTKKEDLGAYEAGVTQEAFTAKDKYDYKGIVENLERYGLCIVPSFIEPSKCDQILEELDPHFYRHDAWQGSPFPKGNNGGDKSSPPLSYCLEGGCVRPKCSSGIQLNSGIVYKVGAGAGDQGYHREDHIHHTIHQACDSFQYGKETLLGVGVAFTDMNKANGATRVIIGSHLWGPHDSCGKFDKRMEFHVNAAKGDAVLFFGQPLPCRKCEPYPRR